MTEFSALFQPGRIGRLQVDNRLIMSSMVTQLVDEKGKITERLLDYYRARINGGVRFVVPQFAAVSPDTTLPFTLALYDDSHIPDWQRLVDAIHESGAKVCIQVAHMGMIFLYTGLVPEGVSIKVPSMMPWLVGSTSYEVVGEADIDRYVEDYAEAARRAMEAGADAVELHACHGCLLSSFMSPLINRRTDSYGGNTENRTRFARRVVERMREKVGAEFPLIVRMNGSDDIEGGTTIDEAVRQAAILESAGVDAISVTAGLEYWSTLNIPCYLFPKGPMVPLAERVKKAVKVPVVAVGKIDVEMAEEILRDGKADFVAMCRPLMADPELPAKVREGRLEELRRCIYCNNCLKRGPEAGAASCSANPFLYRESKYPLVPTESPRDVVVIGGGLAGMEVALYLAQRGHQVSLYEKGTRLGGQWNIACAAPGKEGYASLTDYLKRSLDKYGVEVTLGTEVTRETVSEMKPDVVVVATGAIPLWLDVPGARGGHVVQAHDVMGGEVDPQGRVVVVGGRFVGMELAIWLAERGREVSLVTRSGLGGSGVKPIKLNFKTLANRLVELGVPLYLNATVLEITDTGVAMLLEDEIFLLPADTVVLALGTQSDNKLARELEDTGLEVHEVGDCVRPRDAAEVAYQAARLAASI